VRDSDGGAGTRGQPAGGSVQAPLRHRPHAPVSPGSGSSGVRGLRVAERSRTVPARVAPRGGWVLGCAGAARALGLGSGLPPCLVGGGVVGLCRVFVQLPGAGYIKTS
jgi:hypothetical protein